MSENYRLSSVIDYYMLLTLQFEAENGVGAFASRSQEKFLADVADAISDYEDGLSTVIFNYIVLACAGEARHAESLSGGHIPDLDHHGFSHSRSWACGIIVKYEPKAALEQFIDLFMNYHWSSAYGGEKWGEMATYAYKFATGEYTRQFFIDHIVDLEHNGGFAFNKEEALEAAGLTYDLGRDRLVEFLSLKTFSSSLLRVELPEWTFRYITGKVARFVTRYFNIFRRGEEPDENFAACDKAAVAVKVIEWGKALLDDVEEVERDTCERCGDSLDEGEACCDRHGNHYCQDCFYEDHWQCDHCSDWHSEDTSYATVDGEKWCQDCADSYAEYCNNCEEYTHGSVYTVDGETWCYDCAHSSAVHECDWCGEYTTQDLVTVEGKHSFYDLCPDCVEEHATTCALCGALWLTQDMTEDPVTGLYVCDCDECQAEYTDNPNGLYEKQSAQPTEGQLTLPTM